MRACMHEQVELAAAGEARGGGSSERDQVIRSRPGTGIPRKPMPSDIALSRPGSARRTLPPLSRPSSSGGRSGARRSAVWCLGPSVASMWVRLGQHAAHHHHYHASCL